MWPRLKKFKKNIDGTRIKKASPELAQEILENNGVTQNIYISAEATLELYQSDPEYGRTFGLTAEELTEAAAMGQTVEVPLAQAIAGLDAEKFNKVKEVMRDPPDAPNLSEAETETHLRDDIERVIKKFREQEEILEVHNNELERLKTEIKEAAQKTPGLATQLEDIGGIAEIYDRFAARHISDMEQRTNFLRRLGVSTRSNTKPLLYQAAMYRNMAETVHDFISEAEAAPPDAKKSYYNMGAVSRAEEVFFRGGSYFRLGSGAPYSQCKVPWYNGAEISTETKEQLWAKYYTGAPERQRQCVERSIIVKRA